MILSITIELLEVVFVTAVVLAEMFSLFLIGSLQKVFNQTCCISIYGSGF